MGHYFMERVVMMQSVAEGILREMTYTEGKFM